MQKLLQHIRELDQFPFRYRLYDQEPWRSLGVRFFPVEKYLVYYQPDENSRTVRIVRIMYGGRKIDRQLPE